MPDCVGLACSDPKGDGVVFPAWQRVGHVRLSARARHPDVLRLVDRAGEHAPLLEVGHRCRIVAGADEQILVERWRAADVGGDVVLIYERRLRGLPNVTEQPGRFAIDLVVVGTRDQRPRHGVLCAGCEEVVIARGLARACRLARRVFRAGSDDVAVGDRVLDAARDCCDCGKLRSAGRDRGCNQAGRDLLVDSRWRTYAVVDRGRLAEVIQEGRAGRLPEVGVKAPGALLVDAIPRRLRNAAPGDPVGRADELEVVGNGNGRGLGGFQRSK